MIQQMMTQWMTLPTPPVALIWREAPAALALQPAKHGFGLALDEADFEQALADYHETARPAAPQVEAQDFEHLYGWFLA